MKNEMLNSIHYTHIGTNKCIQLAQESIFWPGMTNQIKQNIANCPLYLKYAKQNRKSLKSYEILSLPWNKIATSLN